MALLGWMDGTAEWAAAALCNLSLCDADSRQHIAGAGGVKILVELLERICPPEVPHRTAPHRTAPHRTVATAQHSMRHTGQVALEACI